MNTITPVTVENALVFIEKHGVVLASAKGPAPRLIDMIAGEEIAGNWWSHPRGKAIYRVLAQVQESDQVLVCRLLNGKITLVHRRLWPALARLEARFKPQQIARVIEEHTASGRHVARQIPFAQWVPAEILQQAQGMSEAQALALLGSGVPD